MKKIQILNTIPLILFVASCGNNISSDDSIISNIESITSEISEESSNTNSQENEEHESSSVNENTSNYNKEDLNLINKYFSMSFPYLKTKDDMYLLIDNTTNALYPDIEITFFDVTDNDYTIFRNKLASLYVEDYNEIEDGITYYYYSKDDIYIDIYKELSDVTCFIYKEDTSIKTSYSEDEKTLLKTLFTNFDIPFLPCSSYTLSNDTKNNIPDVSFYFDGINKNDANDYVKAFTNQGFEIESSQTDDYGGNEIELVYNDYNVYFYYIITSDYNYAAIEIYQDTDDSGNTDDDSDDYSDIENVITNKEKGLPSSTSGTYDVNFASNKVNIKNVTELNDYLDGCPTTNSPSILVIPVQFSDVLAKDKGYTIENIKNAFLSTKETNANLPYYSVYDYFATSSYNKLDLNIDILDEWFTPANKSTYYENKTLKLDSQTITAGEQYVMNEALSYLDKKGVDLSKYDSDDNGTIDAIVLINTLDIDEDGENTYYWAFRYWNYLNNNGEYYEYDNVYANDYLWCSYQFLYEDEDGFNGKNPTNTYTFIHEFSHILGADDYYDTAYVNHPLNGYDIMDSATADHSPYTKFVLGWITTSKLVVAKDSITLDLNSFEDTGDTILIANNFDETLGMFQEYYVVTYYNNTKLNKAPYGLFEDAGIVVYHINASLYKDNYDGEDYYYIYNTNTDSSDSDYGTKDNLVELIKNGDEYVFNVNDTLSKNIKDDNGDTIPYTFVINSINDNVANITFTKN